MPRKSAGIRQQTVSRMAAGLASALAAASALGAEPLSAETQAERVRALAPSVVQVEYHLQFDARGTAPRGSGWGERCPNCGRFHGNPLERYVTEERPLQTAGFLADPRTVVAPDIQVDGRFVRKIRVRQGAHETDAVIDGFAVDQNALRLQLAEPLANARPLPFDAEAEPPYATVSYSFLNGAWTWNIQPLSTTLVMPKNQAPFLATPNYSLIVGADGAPAGLSMNGELAADGSWKGAPLDWRFLAAAELENRLADLEAHLALALPHVALQMRSPRSAPAAHAHHRFSHRDDDEAQRDTLGLVLAPDRLLVLADLEPRTTARLENIGIRAPGQAPLSARFHGSLKDKGALLAHVDDPGLAGLTLSGQDMADYRNQLLLVADIVQHGEQRTTHVSHTRIAALQAGWRQRLYPEMAGQFDNAFLFNLAGELVALPLARRTPPSSERHHFRHYRGGRITPARHVRDLLADLDGAFDTANVPVGEEAEGRLAWLGVTLQPLTRDLARANAVSDQTQDGQTGALIAHVHPESPAAAAGIEPGMTLLRLHAEGVPHPLPVQLQESYTQPFPWDQLDHIPEQYFEQIPPPWPSAENEFTRMLTDLGAGTEYVAVFSRGGDSIEKKFVVETGPPHYEVAPRHRCDTLGLTVRNTTAEVLRYLQRGAEDPGVVVSRVEAGGRASVAGVKPYELITHINHTPVRSVQDFARLADAAGALSLSVKRMAAERIVKIDGTGDPG